MGQIKVTYNLSGIEGLCMIESTLHGDDRGYFMETFNQKDMYEAGLYFSFVQDNQSMSTKGVLRGLHFENVDIDTLYKESDIISLHAVGINENLHMIGREQFDMMKDGVGIVNCARGLLIDSDAMIDNLGSGKIGFACLDTIEDEFGLYYYDRVGEPLKNRSMAILKSFTNVIVTPHMAFYTDEAVSNMIENSIQGILDYFSALE